MSRLKMEPHGVFKEVTKQCTNKDHYQSVAESGGRRREAAGGPEWVAMGRSPPRCHPVPPSRRPPAPPPAPPAPDATAARPASRGGCGWRLVNDLGTSQGQKTATLSMTLSSPTLMGDSMGDLMSEVMSSGRLQHCDYVPIKIIISQFGWGFRHFREVGQPPKALPFYENLRHPGRWGSPTGRSTAARQDCRGSRVPTDSR
jgi:hypothetical protein